MSRCASTCFGSIPVGTREPDTRTRSTEFELVGQSPAMQQLRQLIETGPTNSRVLIGGKQDGKELVAGHPSAERRRTTVCRGELCAIRDLDRSELFGHEKGSFTGATSMKQTVRAAPDGARCFSMKSPTSLAPKQSAAGATGATIRLSVEPSSESDVPGLAASIRICSKN